MSERITRELRDAMERYCNFKDENRVKLSEREFENLCDAIDAVHANLERENDRLKCELDRVLGELDGMHKTDGISDNSGGFMQNAEHHAWAPESHYVMLPKDSAGEPIHVGDLMDEMLPFGGYAAPAPVDTMELSRGAGGYGWMVKLDAENSALISPKLLRHHTPDTWERIIKDALTMPIHRKVDVAQFVARCKALAGDAE